MLLANMAVARKIAESFPDCAMLRRHAPPKEHLTSRLVCCWVYREGVVMLCCTRCVVMLLCCTRCVVVLLGCTRCVVMLLGCTRCVVMLLCCTRCVVVLLGCTRCVVMLLGCTRCVVMLLCCTRCVVMLLGCTRCCHVVGLYKVCCHVVGLYKMCGHVVGCIAVVLHCHCPCCLVVRRNGVPRHPRGHHQLWSHSRELVISTVSHPITGWTVMSGVLRY